LQKMLDDTITEFGTGEDNETKNEVVTGTDEVNS
jgi:hypothetical protein